jgi:molybdopterin-containing oxidoreductase family membrane subunit
MSGEGLTAREKKIMAPLVRTSTPFFLVVGLLAGLLLFANLAWFRQLDEGLGVTGMNDRVSWGIYISGFIYFIGISYGGTMVSAILRLTKTEWRRPITRVAEASTASALIVALMMPIFDMGRPERVWSLILYGRIESPLVWDFISLGTYLAASLLFLYLALIPDLATLDRVLPQRIRARRAAYRFLKMRWQGTPEQRKWLERALYGISIVIIPIAVSAHTVLSWMFGMTTRTGWHSTIFGPYFVGAALFSGIAIVVIAMWVFRKAHHLEDLITEDHFKKMANILLVFSLVYLYFTLNEYLTVAFQPSADEQILLNTLVFGTYAPYFWFSTLSLILVTVLLAVPRFRTVRWITFSALLLNIALWVKRMVIVVPSMAVPLLPGQEVATYTPTWVEWALTAGSFASFCLIFALMSKVFPMVSLWEVQEGEEEERAAQEAAARAPPAKPAAPPAVSAKGGA